MANSSPDASLIQRGVKQGDIISPLLFNAGLEIAMRRFKNKLVHHGLALDSEQQKSYVKENVRKEIRVFL